MNYTFDMGIWNSVFAVPTELADRHLKLAGGIQLKVILWILRHAGAAFTPQQLAEALALGEEDVTDAVQYWVDCGLLHREDGSTPSFASAAKSMPVTAQPAAAESAPKDPTAKALGPDAPAAPDAGSNTEKRAAAAPGRRKSRPKPDGMHLAKRMAESQEVRDLILESENALGKTLSPALSSALLAFYDDYGLPVEVILMMIHYASDIHKTGTAYIESLGKDWMENEIFTIDAAEGKLKELDERQQAWRALSSMLDIPRRAPSKKESAFAFTWIKDWHMPDRLICEAFERCVDKIGKLSMAYMNRILESWNHAGIRSPEALLASEAAKTAAPDNNKSYDLDELMSLSTFNPVEE